MNSPPKCMSSCLCKISFPCIYSGRFALHVPHLNTSLILHELVSVFYLFFTPTAPQPQPQPHWLQKAEGTESQLAAPAFTRLRDTGWAHINLRIILHCLPPPKKKSHYREVSKETRLVLSSHPLPRWKKTNILCVIWTQISWSYRWVASWQLWMRCALSEGSDRRRSERGFSKSIWMHHYQLCLSAQHPITWPLITSDAFLWKIGKITSPGCKSAMNRCPYAEPLPHYSRRSGQQHLSAVLMKTPPRPS